MDSAVSYNNVHCQFVEGDFFKLLSGENKLQGLYFFLLWILCKKLSTKSLLLAGQKLLYRESVSVTSMHEEKNPPKKQNKKQYPYKKKKARCKIFTNSYKNSNMNKLISSTFLYCPTSYPLFFQHMEKNPGKCCEGQRSPLLCVLHSFNQQSNPSEREIHVQQQL